jgi:hypothetical protein
MSTTNAASFIAAFLVVVSTPSCAAAANKAGSFDRLGFTDQAKVTSTRCWYVEARRRSCRHPDRVNQTPKKVEDLLNCAPSIFVRHETLFHLPHGACRGATSRVIPRWQLALFSAMTVISFEHFVHDGHRPTVKKRVQRSVADVGFSVLLVCCGRCHSSLAYLLAEAPYVSACISRAGRCHLSCHCFALLSSSCAYPQRE